MQDTCDTHLREMADSDLDDRVAALNNKGIDSCTAQEQSELDGLKVEKKRQRYLDDLDMKRCGGASTSLAASQRDRTDH